MEGNNNGMLPYVLKGLVSIVGIFLVGSEEQGSGWDEGDAA